MTKAVNMGWGLIQFDNELMDFLFPLTGLFFFPKGLLTVPTSGLVQGS